jgi:bifunctional non-homologous end joining protein LigD
MVTPSTVWARRAGTPRGAVAGRSPSAPSGSSASISGALASDHRRRAPLAVADAFDLIELNGDDMRRDPLEVRKATLRSMLAKAGLGLRFNEHMEGDGPTVFAHACKMGLEGIVSKRKDSPYRSGRSPDWLKMKNTAAPAVKREAEEDWGR